MKLARLKVTVCILICSAAVVAVTSNGSSQQKKKKGTISAATSLVERGEYLTIVGGCNDCHSPKIITPKGPVPDTTRLLSGHPANDSLPPLPAGLIGPTAERWGAVSTNGLTAWTGPWGTTFSSNLTPDIETGIGTWTEDMFTVGMCNGRHMGSGRQILPPMPWYNYGRMTKEDLQAIFAYLKSLKPVVNAVPEAISPTGARIPTPNVLR